MARDKSVSHSGNFQSDAEYVGTGGDVERHAVNVAPATLLTRSGTLIVRMCLPPGNDPDAAGAGQFELQFVAARRSAGLASSRMR